WATPPSTARRSGPSPTPSSPGELAPQAPHLSLQLLQVARVDHDVVRAGDLLLWRHLGRLAPRHLLGAQPGALGQAPRPQLGGGVHHYDDVVVTLEARLEEERHV